MKKLNKKESARREAIHALNAGMTPRVFAKGSKPKRKR